MPANITCFLSMHPMTKEYVQGLLGTAFAYLLYSSLPSPSPTSIFVRFGFVPSDGTCSQHQVCTHHAIAISPQMPEHLMRVMSLFTKHAQVLTHAMFLMLVLAA
jgi:hypothetical protein